MTTVKERLEMWIACDKNKDLQAMQMELCRRDPVYWFDNFCWTFDPRKASDGSTGELPFNLYPYQRWCINEWYGCIERQEDFGVEKSRDMGVSWMLMLLFQYGWIFREGWHFHVGSRKEKEVDESPLDASTLFGKFRFNLYRLPHWMRPEGFERKDRKIALENPQNGNILTGESANASFGRGPRKRAILLDEFAFWDCADAAYGGCSATTKCRIVTSTPFGESNRYAKLMNNPSNERVVYPDQEDWHRIKGLIVEEKV